MRANARSTSCRCARLSRWRARCKLVRNPQGHVTAGCYPMTIRMEPGACRLPPSLSTTSRFIAGYREPIFPGTAGPFGWRGPLQFPSQPSERPSPLRGGVPRGCFQVLHSFHGLRPDGPGSALPCPHRSDPYRRGRLRLMLLAARSLPPMGFRRWASTRPVSRPSRQPATGPPGGYPDRTLTGWRRRACDQVRSLDNHLLISGCTLGRGLTTHRYPRSPVLCRDSPMSP